MTPDQKQAEFQLQIEDLDFRNAVEVSRALGIAAQAIQQLGHADLEPAVRFLWTLALGMSASALAKAEAEGIQPQRTQAELEAILEAQAKKRLN